MVDLASEKCVACSGEADRLESGEIQDLMETLDGGWDLVDGHHIERKFEFKNFEEALEFVNRIGEIAEEQGHHPEIEFTWGEAVIRFYTHKIDGLHRSDFVMAAKVDEAFRQFSP